MTPTPTRPEALARLREARARVQRAEDALLDARNKSIAAFEAAWPIGMRVRMKRNHGNTGEVRGYSFERVPVTWDNGSISAESPDILEEESPNEQPD